MRTIRKATLLANIADRFRDANQRRGNWIPAPDQRDPAEIHAKLTQLSADASEADIVAIIGDNRYTANICDECQQDKPVTVLVAEEIHHPTDSVAICSDCLQDALSLVKE